jgi:hypothetical protein
MELVLAARAPAGWRGVAEPIDPAAVRIRGSRIRFNRHNLTG